MLRPGWRSPKGAKAPYLLLPAENLYRRQNQWKSQVAIHSDWSGDFYAILRGGKNGDQIHLTLIENPLMRWLWSAGWIGLAGALVVLWPPQHRRKHPQITQILADESRNKRKEPVSCHASLNLRKSA